MVRQELMDLYLKFQIGHSLEVNINLNLGVAGNQQKHLLFFILTVPCA